MRSPVLLLALAAALLAAGCQPTASTPDKPKDAAGTTQPEANAEPAAPKIEDLSADLKHEGFQYFGLGTGNTLVYQTSLSGIIDEGTQTSTLAELKDGEAVFAIERGGNLTQLGRERIRVNKDGVFLIEAQQFGKLEPALIALPAKVEIGRTWQAEQTVYGPANEPIRLKMEFKIERREKVKVPAGEYEAILVTTKGTTSRDNKSAPVSGKAWYAANVGPVKLEVQAVNQEGKPVTQTIQLARIETPKSNDSAAAPSP